MKKCIFCHFLDPFFSAFAPHKPTFRWGNTIGRENDTKKRVPLARFFVVFLTQKIASFYGLKTHPRPRKCCNLQHELRVAQKRTKNATRKKTKKRLKKGTPKWAPKPPEFEFRWGKTIGFFETRFFDQKKRTFLGPPSGPPLARKPCVLQCFWTICEGQKSAKMATFEKLIHEKSSWRARVESIRSKLVYVPSWPSV